MVDKFSDTVRPRRVHRQSTSRNTPPATPKNQAPPLFFLPPSTPTQWSGCQIPHNLVHSDTPSESFSRYGSRREVLALRAKMQTASTTLDKRRSGSRGPNSNSEHRPCAASRVCSARHVEAIIKIGRPRISAPALPWLGFRQANQRACFLSCSRDPPASSANPK